MTTQGLSDLAVGAWATDPGGRGEGRFQARKTASGAVNFYYRFTNSEGAQERIAIGPYDRDGRVGLTLAQAREKSRELTRRYLAGDRDLRAELQAEADARKAAREAEDAEKELRKREDAATLGALLTGYVDQLKRDGKTSAKHVGRALSLHVEQAHPKLWSHPASKITGDDLLDVLTPLASPSPTKTDPEPAPRLREAAKLRSYLRAAFAAAVRARHDARALPALRALKLTSNPARDLATIEGAIKARDRALSVSELRAYWRRICALPKPWGPVLRFHLLTGGQRIEQLTRATLADLDADARALTLWDAKGRRKEPRRHVVPLLPEAEAALAELTTARPGSTTVDARVGEFVFTASNGAEPTSYSGCAAAVREVAASMAEAGELDAGKGPFTIGDLRRTVETRLAALGVPLDVRAQLQSHGLGGLQARHYDRHSYLDEKRAALEKLRDLLNAAPASVSSIRGRRKVSPRLKG